MRVTLDLDRPSQIRLFRTFYNMRHICGVDEIRVSARGEGFHFIRRGLRITYEQSLTIRAMLEECEGRLGFDTETTLKPRMILWKFKKLYKGSPVKFPEIRLVKGDIVLEGGNGDMSRTITERDLLALPWKSIPPREVFTRRR